MQLPTCPTCQSTTARCIRPSGHQADHWHVEREDLLAQACRCRAICIPWLERRGRRPQQASPNPTLPGI